MLRNQTHTGSIDSRIINSYPKEGVNICGNDSRKCRKITILVNLKQHCYRGSACTGISNHLIVILFCGSDERKRIYKLIFTIFFLILDIFNSDLTL